MANFNILSVIIYPRKSREDEQREKETGEDSLATMTNLLTSTCNRLAIPFSQSNIMPEIGSADTIDGRPVFSRIINELLPSGKYHGIAVREISRLGRGNFADAGRIYETIISNKIYVITPNRTYDPTNSSDLRFIRMELFMAREEYEMTKERLWYGKDARGKQGYATHYLPVLGLKSYRGKFTLIPEELETLRRIFTMRSDGISFTKIANTFNSEGFLSKKKKQWDPTSIREITNNKRYIGIATWDSQEITAQHPPLVDIELWHKVQKVNKSRSVPSNRVNNPYIVELFCHECGSRMYGTMHKSKSRKDANGQRKIYNQYLIYECTSRKLNIRCAHRIKADVVHEFIFNELRKTINAPVWNGLIKQWNIKRQSDNFEELLKSKQGLLKTKESFLVRLDADYAAEDLSAVLYSKQFEQAQRMVDSLKLEIGHIQKKLREKSSVKQSPNSIKKELIKIIQQWDQLTNQQRKDTLKLVFDKVEVDKNGKFYIARSLPETF